MKDLYTFDKDLVISCRCIVLKKFIDQTHHDIQHKIVQNISKCNLFQILSAVNFFQGVFFSFHFNNLVVLKHKRQKIISNEKLKTLCIFF